MPKSPEELFAAALELTSPVERAALLDRECAANPALRAEVESLLAANDQANMFLNKSTVGPNDSLERPGDRIGRYKLREKVGEGGCGVGGEGARRAVAGDSDRFMVPMHAKKRKGLSMNRPFRVPALAGPNRLKAGLQTRGVPPGQVHGPNAFGKTKADSP